MCKTLLQHFPIPYYILLLPTLVEIVMYDDGFVPYPQMAFCIGLDVLAAILSSSAL